ncbi:MAG: transposase [Lachnospiraceae bacterium]|nr:transposase [Lachnospiraceae bacterium]
MLPSRIQYQLQEYLKSFPNRKAVKYFVMDMNQVYRNLAETFLPNATIVINKFHVVRYISWALENVCKRIQKEIHPSKPKILQSTWKLCYSNLLIWQLHHRCKLILIWLV